MRAARLVLLLAAAGCRDAPSLADPHELPPLGPEPYRLTFDPRPDAGPQWSADGETIYYRRGSPVLVPDPDSPGQLITIHTAWLLLKLPVRGGTAEKLVPGLQPREGPGTLSVERASVSPSGDRLAGYTGTLDLGPVCTNLHHFVGCEPSIDNLFGDVDRPVLGPGFLRISPLDGSASPGDPQIEIEFDGRDIDTDPNEFGLETLISRIHPFHQQYATSGRAPVGVSWSADGSRIVFSDGLRLLTWDGSSSPTAIPASEDAVRPAWSPDGSWIAFERLERGGGVTANCEYREPDADGALVCYERVTVWPILSRSLAIVRPDGSELRVLGVEGRDPTWGPASDRLYFTRDDGIWTTDLDGSNVERIAGTEGGIEPAVSPDGTLLAISRVESVNVSDIWIVPIP